jgi:hypothetical protein
MKTSFKTFAAQKTHLLKKIVEAIAPFYCASLLSERTMP